MQVALYLRRSTVDLQPDSLAAQEELLRAYAAKLGYEVVRSYSDSASGRSTTGRDAFGELIEQIKSGADFDAVLVRDVSRWSRAENTDEAGYYEFVCRSHGVQVLYAEESFGPENSPYALLLKSVKRAMAAEFSRDRARLVRSGAARVLREWFWPVGSVPYGLQRVLFNETGQVVRVLARGDRKALAGQRVKLAPGNSASISVVQRIFETYATGQGGVACIAATLNREGIPSPMGFAWTAGSVSHVLRNEAYIGNLVYHQRNGDTPSKLRNLDGSCSDRIIRCEGAHEAIVSAEIWNAVQEQLRATSTRQSDEQLLAALREARKRWQQKPVREVVTGTDLREGYGRPDTDCIGRAVPRALEALKGALAARMNVADFEGGWLIDHLVHVGLKVSLPHTRFGGLHWRFQFTGEEREDVTIGLGFSPPPLVSHVETYFFRAGRRRPHEARPLLDVGLPQRGIGGS